MAAFDRGHSLRSLHPPPAALPSLPLRLATHSRRVGACGAFNKAGFAGILAGVREAERLPYIHGSSNIVGEAAPCRLQAFPYAGEGGKTVGFDG